MKCILLFLLLLYINAKAQTVSLCNCKGFVDTDYEGTISLFDKPGGNTVQLLRNDSQNEDYLLFAIDKTLDSFFHVSIHRNSGKAYDGWVHKSKRLLSFVKNYNGKISLYTDAAASSKIRGFISKASTSSFQIADCKMNWLYLKEYTKAEKKAEGWLESDKQCPNPYTTCN